MADRRIGIVIRRARERKRWTQRDLAEAVGVSRATVDAWENDRTYPRNRVGALEEVLGISLSGEPEPAPDALVPEDEWEAQVLENEDLPDDIKRRFIEDYRRARSEARERRQRRQNGDPARAAG